MTPLLLPHSVKYPNVALMVVAVNVSRVGEAKGVDAKLLLSKFCCCILELIVSDL